MSLSGELRSTFLDLYCRCLVRESITSCRTPLPMQANVFRMITVMTLNVGYFFAVLGGVLFGELIFGRFISSGHIRSATGANIESTIGQN
jgi:hypothetical protein